MEHPLAPSSTDKPLIINDSSKSTFHSHHKISTLPYITLRFSPHISCETINQPSLLNYIRNIFLQMGISTSLRTIPRMIGSYSFHRTKTALF